MKQSIVTVPVEKLLADPAQPSSRQQDLVAVEEPLQIRLNGRDLAIAMRTPGNDDELATGFLFTEGIVGSREDIDRIVTGDNSVELILTDAARARLDANEDVSAQTRNFYLTSSCGVCGKASVDALIAAGCSAPARDTPQVPASLIRDLPNRLRATQPVFEHTGGLHAAALVTPAGDIQLVREDVGRHNAVDKLVGRALLDGKVPLSNHILLVSSRASFELVQKALMAGIPMLCAVGAPSSLAIETALRFGMTLAGFVREGRFNLYSGSGRVTE